jgi:hypothetical protein
MDRLNRQANPMSTDTSGAATAGEDGEDSAGVALANATAGEDGEDSAGVALANAAHGPPQQRPQSHPLPLDADLERTLESIEHDPVDRSEDGAAVCVQAPDRSHSDRRADGSRASVHTLPADVLVIIFAFVDVKTLLLSVHAVCRSWREAMSAM